MLMIQLLALGLMLLVIPTIIGSIFVKVNKNQGMVISSWISGQMVLWAGFLLISVPMILFQRTFTDTCYLVIGYTAVLVIVAIVIKLKQRAVVSDQGAFEHKMPVKISGGEIALWVVFWGLLVLQFVLAAILAYEEGDDAFYIAIATITEEADTMYIKLPYTGGSTGLDARHGLAPFPVWIAYLARFSGMHAAIVAQVILAITLLGMVYGIYYLIARRLCRENLRNVSFFMILVELLTMFGGYSVYSVENFVLVRASQGKAVLAGIVLPFLFYLLMLLTDRIQENKKTGVLYWILMFCTTMSGCLCSTLGTILTCMMLGMAGLCIALSYRKWSMLMPMGCCCIVPVVMALLYFLIR